MKKHLSCGRSLVLPFIFLGLAGTAFGVELPAELASGLGLTRDDGGWSYRRQSCSGETPAPVRLQDSEVMKLAPILDKISALPEAQREETLMADLDRELSRDHDAAKYGSPRDAYLFYRKLSPAGHALTPCGKAMLPGIWLDDAWGGRFHQEADAAPIPAPHDIGKELTLPDSSTVDFDGTHADAAATSPERERHQPDLLVMGRMGRLEGRALWGGGVMARVPVAESGWGSIGADFGFLYNRVKGGTRELGGGQEDYDDHNNQNGHGHEDSHGQGHHMGTHSWQTTESIPDLTIVQLAALYYRTPNLIESLRDFSLEAGGRLGYGWSKAGRTTTRDAYEPRWDNDGRGHEQPRSTESSVAGDRWSRVVPSAFAAASVAASKTFSVRGEVERMFLSGKKDPWVFSLGGQLDF